MRFQGGSRLSHDDVPLSRAAHATTRTVHGAYGTEMRELRRLMRALNEEQRRVLELVK